MTIYFSEEELRWIDKKMFNWQIRKGCPKNLRENIIYKLNILNKKTYKYDGVEMYVNK